MHKYSLLLLLLGSGTLACTSPESAERGGAIGQRIVNGDETLTGSEDVVHIECRAGSQPLDAGTGTLIKNDWVLTAAHVLELCMDANFNLKTNPQFQYEVSVQLPGGATAKGTAFRAHPRWLNQNRDFDVALIQLDGPMPVKDPVSGVTSSSGHIHKISSRSPFEAAGQPGNENFLRCFGWGGFVPIDEFGNSCAGRRLPDGRSVPPDPAQVIPTKLRHATFKTVPELTGTGMVTLPWQTSVASLFTIRNTDPSLQPLGYQSPTKGDSGGPCGDATAEFGREPIEGVMKAIGNSPLCDPVITKSVPAAAFAPWVLQELGPQGLGLMAFDLDLDGGDDTLDVTDNGDGTSNVHVALTSGLIPPFDFLLFVPADQPISLTFGFFNDDGLPDLLTLVDGVLGYNEGSAFGWVDIGAGPDISQYPLSDGATWSNSEAADVNGDGLSDVLVHASDGSEQVFFARVDGTGLSEFGAITHATALIDDDGLDDLVFVTVHNESGKRMLYMDTSFGPTFPLGIEWIHPERGVELVAAELNGSASRPGKELILRVNGDLRYYEWNGFAAIQERSSGVPRYLGSNLATNWVTDLSVENVAQIDGGSVDAVLASFDTGENRQYSGNPSGSPSATPLVVNGLPTPFGDDGKYLDVSGQGNATVAATEVRLKLAVGSDAPQSAKDRLVIELNDGDLGGLNDHGTGDLSAVKTCYLLTSDPCGNAGLGECDFEDPDTQGTFFAAWDSDMMGDDAWTRIDLEHACEASLLSTCPSKSAPYSYELRIFLKERAASDPGDASDCMIPPAPSSVVPNAVISSFKLRSNATISHPEGQLSFEAFDTSGDFGTPWFLPSYMRDTSYDGEFDFDIAGSSAANAINLQEADADYLGDDSTPGLATGANYDIFYALIDPDFNLVELQPADGADEEASDVVLNPSGNYDDVGADRDLEARRFAGPVLDGSYDWFWSSVQAHNNIHIWAPTGSPVTFELLGNHTPRAKLTTAEPLAFWLEPGNLETWLGAPIVLGSLASGALEGASISVSSPAQARSILQGAGTQAIDQLVRQLLLAKLNVRRAQALGERLDAAMIYGVTASLRTTLQAADALVRGPRELTTASEVATLARFLGAVNLGDVTYFRPGIPTSTDIGGDPDGDGLMNLKDNCPPIANADQLDSDKDRVGDACRVVPKLDCVLPIGGARYRAYLGYESPLEFRSIPVGRRNGFTSGQADRGQPSEFGFGLVKRAFSVEFGASESSSWKLEDTTLTVSASSPQCSGAELLTLPFATNVALFAHDELVLQNDAEVRATASAVTSGNFELGNAAQTGSVWARGNALLQNRSHVRGSLVVGGTLQKKTEVVIDGPLVSPGFVAEHVLDWQVPFPPTSQDMLVPPGQTATLAPGSYRDITVKPYSTLTLQVGTYLAESLRLEPGSRLQLSGGAMTTLYVHSQISNEGSFVSPANEPPLLLLGFFGTAELHIDGAFRGAIIAPTAKLVLGREGDGNPEGTFFAKQLLVRAGTVVSYRALGGG